MPNVQTLMGNVPRTSNLQWDSGMSPHKYDLIEKSANVANCWEYYKKSFFTALLSASQYIMQLPNTLIDE